MIQFNDIGPTRPPRNLIVSEITATTIFLSWEPPEEEDINGILDKYQLTYRGRDLDTSLHSMVFSNSLEYFQQAELTGLEENTSYTIQVVLFSSGVSSPPATVIVSTIEAGNYTSYITFIHIRNVLLY